MFGSDGFRVRCPEPLYSQVKDFSQETGRSLSDIIRAALKEYLGRQEKNSDSFKQVSSLPKARKD